MIFLLKILINIFIPGLFLYSKLLPYKDKLTNNFKSSFNFFNAIFTPILTFLKSYIKPFEVGVGLSVDMTQIVLLFILLLINNLI